MQKKNGNIVVDISYDEIPWYRKRWFIVLCVLFFIPAAIGISFTGNVYMQRKDGTVLQYAKSFKWFTVALFAWLCIMAFMRP